MYSNMFLLRVHHSNFRSLFSTPSEQVINERINKTHQCEGRKRKQDFELKNYACALFPNKKGKCGPIFPLRACYAKQNINFFLALRNRLPYLGS